MKTTVVVPLERPDPLRVEAAAAGVEVVEEMMDDPTYRMLVAMTLRQRKDQP